MGNKDRNQSNQSNPPAAPPAAPVTEQSTAADGNTESKLEGQEESQQPTGAPTSPSDIDTLPQAGVPDSPVERPVTQEKVTADIVAAQKAVAAPAPAAAVPGETIFVKYVENIKKMSPIIQSRFANLHAYVDAMRPRRPQTDQSGAAYQRMLLDSIVGIMNDPVHFDTAFGILVQFIKENRDGCFADTHAARFIHALPGSTNERIGFERLLNLLIVLATNEDTALVRKQVNVQHATAHLITPAGTERLLAWLGN